MAANAPYYARQFTDATNTTNATEPQLAPEEEDYGLSAPPSAAALSPRENSQSSLYADYPARQTSADNTFEENHNFVELLEAAETAAAGQAAQVVGLETADAISTTEVAKGKRKRTSDSAMDDTVVEDLASDSKRRRVDMPTDPQLQDSDHDPHGSKAGHIEPSSESLLNEARAAGVHSAAALFRRSTVRTTRKYTRPPMSKLFMSLQLTPENFLQLQARAKAYMLDLRHPERQNCVGNRGKGDTDMVKLRLFNCVRDFLDDRVGEQFFGEHVEKPGEKEASEAAKALGEEQAPTAEDRLTWPRDGNKIISLVTPLMRRMVTNERQRQYAIETRKGGTKKKDNEGSTEAASPQVTSSPCRNGEHQCETAVDPRIDQYSRHQSPSKPTAWMPNTRSTCKGLISQHRTAMPAAEALAADSSIAKSHTSTSTSPYLSHINIFLTLAPHGSKPVIKLDEKRICAGPSAHLAWYDWNDFIREVSTLVNGTKARCAEIDGADNLRGLAVAANALQHEDTDVDAAGSPAPNAQDMPPHVEELPPRYTIKSIGPDGWREIAGEDDWYNMLREKAFAIWADGVCNVLVEVARQPMDRNNGEGNVE